MSFIISVVQLDANDEPVQVEITPECLVREVLAKIAEEIGSDEKKLQLVFEGRILDRKSQVMSSGVVADSELQVELTPKEKAVIRLGCEPTAVGLRDAVMRGDNILDYYTAMELDVNSCPFLLSSSGLFLAASNNNISAVRQLLSHPAIDCNNGRPSATPLAAAVLKGHTDIVQLLLQQPTIEVNTVKCCASGKLSDFKYGGSPLTVACEKGYVDIVKLLLQHPDINPNTVNKRKTSSPLGIACGSAERMEIMEALLSHPRTDVNFIVGEVSPLTAAVAASDPSIVARLLQVPGIDVCISPASITPIMRACECSA